MPFYEELGPNGYRAIVNCDCVGECTELHFAYEDEAPKCIYFSVQPRMSLDFWYGLWYRLKCAWRILIKGSLYENEVVLDMATVKFLAEWIEMLEKND